MFCRSFASVGISKHSTECDSGILLGVAMGCGEQGIGQRHVQHQYFPLKQQGSHLYTNHNGLGGGTDAHPYFPIKQQPLHMQRGSSHSGLSDGLAPGTSLPNSDSTVSPTASPKITTITRPPAIAYRPICPLDLEVLQDVHEAFFPIKYELEFFVNVVHGHGIISWAAIDTNRSDELIGFVTARVVSVEDSEEVDLLGCELLNSDRTLVYVLTLGVIKQYRNNGIASALVGIVTNYAASIPTCRAVYLHVISYNHSAIYFYKKNSFQCLRRLRNFYYINGRHYDSYLYIYFVNGGRSPCSALELLTSASILVKSFFSSLVSKIFWRKESARGLTWSNCNEASGPLNPSPVYNLNAPDTCCV